MIFEVDKFNGKYEKSLVKSAKMKILILPHEKNTSLLSLFCSSQVIRMPLLGISRFILTIKKGYLKTIQAYYLSIEIIYRVHCSQSTNQWICNHILLIRHRFGYNIPFVEWRLGSVLDQESCGADLSSTEV